jgi:hypothetical protein
MSGKEIDLKKIPVWLQYLIAFSVIVGVMTSVWLMGSDDPVPILIEKYLLPNLEKLFLFFLAFAIVVRFLIKRR